MTHMRTLAILLTSILLQGCSGTATPSPAADAGTPVDGGAVKGIYPDGGTWYACRADAGSCACTTDADCAISHSSNDPHSTADCACLTGCGGYFVNQSEESRRVADNQAYCQAWDLPDGFSDGGGCFFLDGICSQQTAACVDTRCVGVVP